MKEIGKNTFVRRYIEEELEYGSILDEETDIVKIENGVRDKISAIRKFYRMKTEKIPDYLDDVTFHLEIAEKMLEEIKRRQEEYPDY